MCISIKKCAKSYNTSKKQAKKKKRTTAIANWGGTAANTQKEVN